MKTYNIMKINAMNNQEINYGCGYTESDVKEITRGYKFDGMFYNRKNSKFFFIVNED